VGDEVEDGGIGTGTGAVDAGDSAVGGGYVEEINK
jgi:hypothetical protein